MVKVLTTVSVYVSNVNRR